MNLLALFTQRLCIISAVKARHFSAFVFDHSEPSSSGIKQLQCVILYSNQAQQNRKRRTVHIMIPRSEWLFSACFHWCPPVNLNMYLLTDYNHMDAAIMYCD